MSTDFKTDAASPDLPGLRRENETGSSPRKRASAVSTIVALLVVLGLAAFGWSALKKHRAAAAPGQPGHGGQPVANLPVPVVAGTVEQKDVPIYLDGLGTVQAFNTVTVRSRVDGQVQRIAFTEGQEVHAGDLLAQIDPGPFEAQLNQNVARKAQDEAQLEVARLNLRRDSELLASKILAQQEYDTQKGVVEQLQAAVQADQAAIDNSKVQLAYTKITSPLEGRTGIRMVDQGNIVHANDTEGLVVITQLRPISVVFTLPEQELNSVHDALTANQALTVQAVARDNATALDQGKLAVIDNQIDTTTGTIRLKATFPNDDLKLWPGQFVNVRLLLRTVKGGAVVPASVVQHGPQGTFAYVISNETALVRPIKVAQIEQGQALIESGLTPGESVVVDGQYRLQKDSKVRPSKSTEPDEPAPASRKPGDESSS